jgi:membrane protein YdbS with pleckstrin-like domain
VPAQRGKPSTAPEPSRYIERYLYPTEKFRGEWRRHWIHLVREVSLLVVVTVLVGYLAGFLSRHHLGGLVIAAVSAWAVTLLWVCYHLYEWHVERFVLTNKRVLLITGFITRNVAMMPLGRVTDMKYTQSPTGRLLNYGTFEIESAGQHQALRKVVQMPHPNSIYLQIVEEMYEPEAVETRLARADAQEELEA